MTPELHRLLGAVGSTHPVPIPQNRALLMAMASHSVQAGFPSPADDVDSKRIDLTERLIRHPQATFLLRVSGESMREAGIFDGDVVIVDKAIKERHQHIVVATVDGEFTIKRLHKRHGQVRLVAANPTYPDIVPREGQEIQVWGVVTAAIKVFPV